MSFDLLSNWIISGHGKKKHWNSKRMYDTKVYENCPIMELEGEKNFQEYFLMEKESIKGKQSFVDKVKTKLLSTFGIVEKSRELSLKQEMIEETQVLTLLMLSKLQSFTY